MLNYVITCITNRTHCCVPRTFLDRAGKIPSTEGPKRQHVVDALKINGYAYYFIKSCQNITTPALNLSQTCRGFVTLPYIQGISQQAARTLNQFNVNAAHKPVETVGSILKKPKHKFDQDPSTGVVHKIKDCEKVYIG